MIYKRNIIQPFFSLSKVSSLGKKVDFKDHTILRHVSRKNQFKSFPMTPLFKFSTQKQQKQHQFTQKSSYFDVLGISPNATEQEIKAVYLQMVKKYHPDLSKQENASQKFQLIQKAYEVLSNPEERSKHKAELNVPNPQMYDDAKIIRQKYKKFKRKDTVADEWQFSYKLFKKHYEQVDAKEKQYTRFPGQGDQYWVHKDEMQIQPKTYLKQFSMIAGSIGITAGTMYYMWQ